MNIAIHHPFSLTKDFSNRTPSATAQQTKLSCRKKRSSDKRYKSTLDSYSPSSQFLSYFVVLQVKGEREREREAAFHHETSPLCHPPPRRDLTGFFRCAVAKWRSFRRAGVPQRPDAMRVVSALLGAAHGCVLRTAQVCIGRRRRLPLRHLLQPRPPPDLQRHSAGRKGPSSTLWPASGGFRQVRQLFR
ncbi:hypothetical protein MUK42_06764 [Musa troglodytarum]|uniref:Uncharacterized protein n=1 Tax=Musa troglodytarum TaxID=320322 RepID=A0A9E7L4W6_9LILI|nr:hypothetical protein MUK42_06764 [Musa troglodytarum]